MIVNHQDTIFALASAHGAAGIAVIRVSGTQSLNSAKKLTGKTNIQPRLATFTSLKDHGGNVIDQAVITYFKGPNSYTGEDTVEYAVHGSRAVIDRLFEEFSSFDSHRMAEAGEFTKRAFVNGKLDLTAAEAVNDLIYAETEAQRALAVDQLSGSLEGLYHNWSSRLAKLLAHQEAEIEFPDEDMPDGIDDNVRKKVNALIDEISDHLDDNNRGERMREGMQIAIIGAPNVGKSSLLNLLARREAAIVSDIAGTTRDVVDVSLNLGGYPVVISDTAGIRHDHSDKVEAEGIRRAIQRAEDADLKVAVFDGSESTMDKDTKNMIDDKTVVVINKTDLGILEYKGPHIAVSCENQNGIQDLVQTLTDQAKSFFAAGGNSPVLTRKRHRENLKACNDFLKNALDADLPELAAEDLRQALMSIGRITGRVDVEQLLDIVFKDFCIGK